jgi:hypothetical protein
MLGGGGVAPDFDRAGQYGVPPDVTDITRWLAEKYKEFDVELKQSLLFHQKFWEAHSDYYRKKFESVLGHEMPAYNVRLNAQADGISDWGGTNISINAFMYLRPFKTGEMVRDLVLESMLSQTFMNVRKRRGAPEMNDKNVWGLAELTAIAIYQTDFCKSDWQIGYKELEPHRGNIKKIYAERKNFQTYLDAAIAYFKNNRLT